MEKQKAIPEAQKKRELGSRLWLGYYNQTLYEKGLITEQERSRMSLKISGWHEQPMGTARGREDSAAP